MIAARHRHARIVVRGFRFSGLEWVCLASFQGWKGFAWPHFEVGKGLFWPLCASPLIHGCAARLSVFARRKRRLSDLSTRGLTFDKSLIHRWMRCKTARLKLSHRAYMPARRLPGVPAGQSRRGGMRMGGRIKVMPSGRYRKSTGPECAKFLLYGTAYTRGGDIGGTDC